MTWEYKYNINDVVDVINDHYHRSGIIIQRVSNLDKTEAIYVVRVDGDDDFFPPKTFYEDELRHSISFIRNKKLEDLGI